MVENFGFGAILDFKTLGLSKMTEAKSALMGLSRTLDTELTAMQKRMAKFAGMTAVGAGLMVAGSKMWDLIDDGVKEARNLEDAVVGLRGKMLDLSESDFNKVVNQMRAIGRVTEYTEAQVIQAGDSLRALGLSSKEIPKAIGHVLNFATATNEIPEIAGAVMMNAKNVFKLTADNFEEIADVLMTAKNTTALASSDLGIREFEHLFKNVAKFVDTIPMKLNEMVGISAAFREVGMSARLAGLKIGQLGKAFAKIEFAKEDELKRFGIFMRDPLTGKRFSFIELFRQFGEKYNEWSKELGIKEADRRLEGVLGNEASGAFNILFSKVKKLGGFKEFDKWIELFNGKNLKGASEQIKKMRLETYTGQLKLAEGLWASILSTVGKTWKQMKIVPLKMVNKLLDKLAGSLAESEEKARFFALVFAGGSIFFKIAGGIMVLVGALGMLNAMAMQAGMASLGSMFMFGFKSLLTGAMYFGVITLALVALAGVVYLVYTNWDTLVSFFKEHQEVFKGVAILVGALAIALTYLKTVTMLSTVATWLFNSALWANPITWVIAGVLGLIAVGILLYKNWDKVSLKLQKVWHDLKWGFVGLWNIVESKFNNVVDGIKSKVSSLVDAVSNKFKEIKDLFLGFIADLILKLPEFVIDLVPGGEGMLSWAKEVKGIAVDDGSEKASSVGANVNPDVFYGNMMPAMAVSDSLQSPLNFNANIQVTGDISEEQRMQLERSVAMAVNDAIERKQRLEMEKR